MLIIFSHDKAVLFARQCYNSADVNLVACGFIYYTLVSQQDYITGSKVTLADIFAYPEIYQCADNCCRLVDFTPYPNVVAWIERMKQVTRTQSGR